MRKHRQRARQQMAELIHSMGTITDDVYHDLLSLHRTMVYPGTGRSASPAERLAAWEPTRGAPLTRHMTTVLAHLTAYHRSTPPYIAVHDVARLGATVLSDRLSDVGTVAIPLQDVVRSPDDTFLKFVDAEQDRRTDRATLFLAAQLFLLLLVEQDAVHTAVDTLDCLVAPPNTPRNQLFLVVIMWAHLARGLQQYMTEPPNSAASPFAWQHPIRTQRGLAFLQDATLQQTVDMVQETWDDRLWQESRFDERHVYDHREEGAWWDQERSADGASLNDDWQPKGWWKAWKYRRWKERDTWYQRWYS